MDNKTYADKVVELTTVIHAKAVAIRELEKSRREWTTPKGASIHLGQHIYLVRNEGVYPPLAAVHREILAYLDDRLHTLRGELEGLRFKLINLGRST